MLLGLTFNFFVQIGFVRFTFYCTDHLRGRAPASSRLLCTSCICRPGRISCWPDSRHTGQSPTCTCTWSPATRQSQTFCQNICKHSDMEHILTHPPFEVKYQMLYLWRLFVKPWLFSDWTLSQKPRRLQSQARPRREGLAGTRIRLGPLKLWPLR